MKAEMKGMQKLKGIGEVLSQRLIEAGYDTFAKVAAAAEEELRKIPGINPRQISSIVTQAAELAEEAEKGRAEKVEELKKKARLLKGNVQEIAQSVRNRLQEAVSGNAGKKMGKEILKLIASLEKLEGVLEKRVKKGGKGLVKAEKRLEGLADAGLKEIGTGLKKARKSLKKALGK
jgi:Cu/Ag efflux pump CusA